MVQKVSIIDYGIGNLLSVRRAFEKCGAEVIHVDTPEGVLAADRLVLPGVGAFSKGMQGLRDRELIAALQEYPAAGRPMMGICLGMQMLFEKSYEFGEHNGLGLLSGRIMPIEPRNEQGEPLKVPHIGWAPLQSVEGNSWAGSILSEQTSPVHAYFVHSYTAIPDHEPDRLADTYYGDARISAMVRRENVYGCQFHPEKSAWAGLKIIKQFLNL